MSPDPGSPAPPADRRHRLTGTIDLPLPPAAAFPLFTPRGEERWVEGWRPLFATPTEDDTAPGTVFQTHAGHPATTWVVLDRTPAHHIRYARLTPGDRAGTVTVDLTETPQGSRIEVTYDLTALTGSAAEALDAFAAGYPAHLDSWKTAITAALAREDAR